MGAGIDKQGIPTAVFGIVGALASARTPESKVLGLAIIKQGITLMCPALASSSLMGTTAEPASSGLATTIKHTCGFTVTTWPEPELVPEPAPEPVGVATAPLLPLLPLFVLVPPETETEPET